MVDKRPGPAVPGQRLEAGGLSYYVAGSGPPLLLLHSVNAAASAAEVRPLFERWSAQRTVFAPDLPGFGFSSRVARSYTPRLMTDTLHSISALVAQRCGFVPVDALALSLGCEYLARAAVEQPTRWGRLAFVSPTGFDGRRPRRGAPGSRRRAVPALCRVLSAPLWAEWLFAWLTRPAVVRHFLRRTWGGPDIDEAMAAYAVATAAMPGAHHAPLQFLAGALFSNDIHTVYEAIRQPVWMCHGVRGDFSDYQGKALVQCRPNWQFTVFDSGALPYFEQPQAFDHALQAFLAGRRVALTAPG